MTRKYFGTDGIRGTANQSPMTAEIALKVGMAAGRYFANKEGRHSRVVIAKDTRLSGYMLEPALTAGFVATGMDVVLVGPLPTPAVAMLARSMRADLGVMISASHNPYQDNGIKLFGPDGFKLSDDAEMEIERLIDNIASPLAGRDGTGRETANASSVGASATGGGAGSLGTPQPPPTQPSPAGGEGFILAPASGLGRAKRLEDARGRYIEFAKGAFPKHLTLDGLKIVIDCANGAAYQVGPVILSELGAEVFAIGIHPNGININEACGSTHPKALQEEVLKQRAHLGIALDGDADRLIVCDEKGDLLDGDQVMAMVAAVWHKAGLLKGGGIVATEMSNMGLERFLKSLGLDLIRTKVGDRYVVEAMREKGYNVGGEQSGHIILSDYATTGDGLMAALQLLALLVEDGRPLSQAGRLFTPLPQILKNIRYQGGKPLEAASVQSAIASGRESLNGAGRVFIRASGTEPVIRVMAEGEDEKLVRRVVDAICAAVEKAA